MWGAIAFGPGTTSTQPAPRLELYPIPSANTTAALKIPYRAGWSSLSGADSAYVQVPEYMNMLYLEAARRTAVCWEKSENLAQSLTELMLSTLYTGAVARDARHQTDMGVIVNGAVRRSSGLVPNTVPWTVVVT